MNLRARHLTPLLLLLAGCQAAPEATPTLDQGLPSFVGWRPFDLAVSPRDHATVPDFGGGVLMVESGDFAFTGETAHGDATFDHAVLFDPSSDAMPTDGGTGGFSLEIDGTRYEAADLSTIGAVLPDAGDGGETYLVLGGFRLETDATGRDIGSVIWAMVPLSDVTAGATVTLDGERTLAYFASGPIDSESPDLVAITASGSITFGDDLPATFDVGATLSASLEGEFGRVDVTDPGPGLGLGPGPGIDPTGMAAGDYTLSFAGTGAEIFCDGALAGHEADFAGLAPDALGLAGGAVTVVSPDVRTIVLSGAVIETSFASPSLDASWQDDAGFYIGFADHGGVSMGGGARVGSFAFLAPGDDSTGRALFVGAVFAADPAMPDAGQCQIGWEATLAL